MITPTNNEKGSIRDYSALFAAANEIQEGQQPQSMRRSVGPGDLNGKSPRKYLIGLRIQDLKRKP